MDDRETAEQQYIQELAADCDKCSSAYWKKYYYYKSLSTILSIPVIFLSSGTVLVSQILSSYCNIMVSIVTGFGITSTIFSTLQRYKSYDDRAAVCRNFAKSFDKIARNIHFRESGELRGMELKHFIMHILSNIEGLVFENEYENISIQIPKRLLRPFNITNYTRPVLQATRSAPSAIWLDMAASTLNAPIISHRKHFNQDKNSEDSPTNSKIPTTRMLDIRSSSSTDPVSEVIYGNVLRSKSFTYSPRTYSGDALV